MKTIGLTGGIGSGKTFVSSILEKLGFPVFNSDQVAQTLMNEDKDIREHLHSYFGENCYLDGKLNRGWLAEILFNDPMARKFVNGVVHPRVQSQFKEFCAQNASPFVFNESAILFETGAYKNFDLMALVTAPTTNKIQRIMERNGLSQEAIEKRMDSQWDDQEKIPLADFVIQNDGQPLLIQIEQMLDLFNNQSCIEVQK
jgi:dephospho-CoA kinase